MWERYLQRTGEAGTEAEGEQITEAEGGAEAVKIVGGEWRYSLQRIASTVLLIDERDVMGITVSGRKQTEVAADEDTGERRTRFCFAD
jgi:hypothetical protein